MKFVTNQILYKSWKWSGDLFFYTCKNIWSLRKPVAGFDYYCGTMKIQRFLRVSNTGTRRSTLVTPEFIIRNRLFMVIERRHGVLPSSVVRVFTNQLTVRNVVTFYKFTWSLKSCKRFRLVLGIEETLSLLLNDPFFTRGSLSSSLLQNFLRSSTVSFVWYKEFDFSYDVLQPSSDENIRVIFTLIWTFRDYEGRFQQISSFVEVGNHSW